ncbi:uncharacterized protein HLK63_H03047 [Nakaseomyces glabratus]|nr:Eukaryotic RNA Recognition Motif (RRM) profile [Nakaseomyces glabratus]QNG14271.1 uncharacterized protein GWK60_H03069 [Nakaseomyces glabratus]UCS20904.1 uncharacterized protein GW608_H03047 [Nakaseomyces glabratus]UCS26135.1 uncharacterized protein HLK63_H03047 [Nakaseomyces glabratus]UCS31365.1 uncharacterized protein HLK64_H03047 [Nakaseomyces glabratus]
MSDTGSVESEKSDFQDSRETPMPESSETPIPDSNESVVNDVSHQTSVIEENSVNEHELENAMNQTEDKQDEHRSNLEEYQSINQGENVHNKEGDSDEDENKDEDGDEDEDEDEEALARDLYSDDQTIDNNGSSATTGNNEDQTVKEQDNENETSQEQYLQPSSEDEEELKNDDDDVVNNEPTVLEDNLENTEFDGNHVNEQGTEDQNSSESKSTSNDNETSGDVEQQQPANANIVAQILSESFEKENVDANLIEKQVKFIEDSHLLEKTQFQKLTDTEKITVVLKLLNSNTETKFQATNKKANAVVDSNGLRLFPKPDITKPMTPEESVRYNDYLKGENKITEMHSIPPKSRLFIGNLPLKNVSKQDLFRLFSPFGHILQINIKNAFGFIQYDNPKSVRAAIECESQEINFGKKLILEVSSSNNRPQYDHGDHGTNSSSTFISTSKRPFQHEDEEPVDMYAENNNAHKKPKRRTPSCVIFVKRTADRNYANEVFNKFNNMTGLETDMVFLKPRLELRKLVNDAAYEGVWGVILVNKTRNLDVQTFHPGPRGETKFDEYVSVSADDAAAIFNNLKVIKNRSGGMPPLAGPQSGYPQQSVPNMMPQPQQGYYGNYNYGQQPKPQQQANFYPQMPTQNTSYGQPGMAPAVQGYGAPTSQPPMNMGGGSYSRYDNSSMQQPMSNNQPMNQQQLLAAIQNLPPNVVSNLLSMAQQQQQQPDSQQQILNMIQSMQTPQQNQQQQQQQQQPVNMPPQNSFGGNVQPSNQPTNPVSPSAAANQQDQQPANNVQSLLDSLTQLQK